MVNLIKRNSIRIKMILVFIVAILFSQLYINQVVADEDQIKDGALEINSGDWINILIGTNATISWQFQVDTNERAIYWEIKEDNILFFKSGWGPNANCTTPVLNDTKSRLEFVCHGYYAKYHVWSTIIVTCTKTGQPKGGGNNGFDPIIFLSIGIPVVSVVVIASVILIYLRRKKKKEFF
ncbi:MAG: hypothetical protein ACFFB0_15635 [Promethearchaeota archaeon]